MTVKTNAMVTVLTIVTVIIWIMTFLTWLYGMNVALPWQDFSRTFAILIGVMLSIWWGMLWYFSKKWRL
jgi:Mg2+ and Co2+ transporter CorA